MNKGNQSLAFRWGENDHYWWRFTFAKNTHQREVAAYIKSAGDEDRGEVCCYLRLSLFNHTVIVTLPEFIKPHRQWVSTGHYEWASSPDAGYFHVRPRQYGFTYSPDDGFLNVFLGRQTDDSATEQRWACFLPWKQWRHVRFSILGKNGEHVWSDNSCHGIEAIDEQLARQKQSPNVRFLFQDYDGTVITATTQIHEREYRFGVKWFIWLSFFRKPRIYRTLNIEFDAEVGPGKHSWKGGTLGHGIKLLPGELHEAAFRRYCNEQHSSRRGDYKLTFICRLDD